MTRDRRLGLVSAPLLILTLGFLLATPAARAAGLLDVPLKPWTYFETNRDWAYTAIEKLVTAGLVGPWVLNTKPMSRMEMARIVAVALRKIQEDEVGRLSRRSDLEPTLYALMDELAPELRTLGIRNGETEFVGQPWLDLQPITRLQVRGFGVKEDARPENTQGLNLVRRYEGTVGFASTLQVGEWLSAYLHPEFQGGEGPRDLRLVEGYLKLKLNNVALRVGRESVWWGPGYHGGLMFSNNAPPMNQVRIGTAEPFLLPGFLKVLGPTRLELLYAVLEGNRDFPHAMIGAWRMDISPSPLLELGVARLVQFGGSGRPSLSPLDYLLVLGVSKDDLNSKFNTNQLYTLDATLRLHDVDRVFPLSRDLTLYGELEVDDTCCEDIYWPFKPAFMVGLYLPNVFGRNETELRVEWANSTSFTYSNGIYTSGVSFEGFPLGHYMGTRGQDLYIRTAERLHPNLQVATEFGFSKVGPTDFFKLSLPREERTFAGVDISFQPIPALSMLLGYRYERTQNKGFVADRRETNHMVRLEATYSFAPWERTQFGRLRRSDVLRPVTPPPPAGTEPPADIDPDEVVSLAYAGRLLRDTGTILTSPLRWDTRDWLIFAGVGLATGGLMFADKEIRNSVQKNRSSATDTLSDILQPFETAVPAALVTGMYVAGHALDRPDLKAASADALEASLISLGVFATPMKFLSGRSRPDKNQGPAHYDPFNLGSSLPSFTTVGAFSVASVLSEHFPHPAVSILAYGLAGAAGLTRIYDDKHWASDVLLGAAIGTAVGKAVVKLNETRREKSRVSVIPLMGGGTQGAVLQVEF